MTELDGGKCTIRAEKVGDTPILRNVSVAVNTGAVMDFARTFLDRRFLAKDDTCTAQRKFTEVH